MEEKNRINFYERGEFNYRRSYNDCKVQESKRPDANPFNCEHLKNIADDYAAKAAAARQGQQLDTTRSSQAMRNYLQQLYPTVPPGYFDSIPSPEVLRSSSVGRVPRMPSYIIRN